MDDLVLSADVTASLIDFKPDIEVTANDGIVHISTTVPESQEEALLKKVHEKVKGIRGVKEIKLHTFSSIPYDD